MGVSTTASPPQPIGEAAPAAVSTTYRAYHIPTLKIQVKDTEWLLKICHPMDASACFTDGMIIIIIGLGQDL